MNAEEGTDYEDDPLSLENTTDHGDDDVDDPLADGMQKRLKRLELAVNSAIVSASSDESPGPTVMKVDTRGVGTSGSD